MATQPDGYLAMPPNDTGDPVLVLHAWWGLNDTIKDFCNRLAEAGFVVFAPDLYHGKIADTIEGAEKLGKALGGNFEQAKREVEQAAAFLIERAGQSSDSPTDNGLAVIGFSLGAFYALDLSVEKPELVHSVVVFYGTGVEDFSNAEAAYLGHFAESDNYEPQENVDRLEDALKDAGRSATIHRYPGTGHWFFEPDRTDAYDQAAAEMAFERTLEFLQRGPTL
jgi:carboxymethylenebutenolidase